MRSVGSGFTLKRKLVLLLLVVLVVAWVCFIFSNSLKTAEASDGQSGRIVNFIIRSILRISDEKTIEEFAGTMNFFVRKIAHFTEFAVLSILLFLFFLIWGKRNRSNFIFSMAGVFAVAVCDELLQLLSDGRACRFFDVIIDCAGGAFGCAVACAVCFVVSFVKKKSNVRLRGTDG